MAVSAGKKDLAALGNVAVLGIGGTGMAVARYLAAKVPGRASSVTLFGGAASRPCERSVELEALGVRCVLGTDELDGHFDLAVASPGIPPTSPLMASAQAHASEVIGEPEFAWRESPERWVGITGTNGKTTTTTLTTAILNAGGLPAEAVGNIGTIITGELASRPDDQWFVAELSSFQLAGAKRLHPRIACLLNVTPDHVEWHGSLEAYAAAKENIFRNLQPGDLAVVSDEDDWCRAVIGRLEARGLRVCRVDVHAEPAASCAAFQRAGRLVVRLDGEEHYLVAFSDMVLKGEHNVQNSLAAASVALELGVPDDVVRSALRSFSPLEHRIEPAGDAAGVHYVNDSKGTNTDATVKALTAFEPGTIVVMLGGHDKGTDLGPLSAAVAARCRVAVCYGAAGPRMAEACQAAGARTLLVPHMADAFRTAVAEARPGETVLLSPACSSFDEFHNMEERGETFKRYVRELADKGSLPAASADARVGA